MVHDFGQNVFALNHGSEFMNWFTSICLKGSGIGTIQTAISLRDEDVYQDLFEIKVTTLIMHGVLDKICPFSFAFCIFLKADLTANASPPRFWVRFLSHRKARLS